ncbi:SRPBCC family protein [Cytobacillus purgationiresistens]|uniref:Uncharacterized protein YndB with AHSA1/START domain n=1 Tax=Cytobacillus purgationiresistens TaxID=863449 RepID=A0ABU0AJK3_9BACI|nr:SRPBCC domain-containing protein [Cytobacillus purgationiresistens]MDQ0271427.1 uncharacterized protein YndB with AHSA1/START domain [Cytobacillus purgationiresistens]
MTSTLNERAIKKKVNIYAPKSLVWLAWIDSARVAEWFAPEAVIEAKEGGAYELFFIPGNKQEMNTKGCKIIKMATENELQFTWRGPDPFNELMNAENDLTVVQVSLEKIDESTTSVHINHTGFKNDDNWSEAFKWHEMAWSGVLKSLKENLKKAKEIYAASLKELFLIERQVC